MGNRAVITTHPYHPAHVGIYVHWNGGRASVEGFLRACKELKFRSPEIDSYGIARLTQAITAYFGSDGLSVGVDVCSSLDCNNGDNGTYLIGNNWSIVGRKFSGGEEVDENKTKAIAEIIVKRILALDDINVGVETAPVAGRLEEALKGRDPLTAAAITSGKLVVVEL
tara:strand:- start:725 stop:1228 length:504 start_codon:yes stop_codon:yes gene_type:complete